MNEVEPNYGLFLLSMAARRTAINEGSPGSMLFDTDVSNGSILSRFS